MKIEWKSKPIFTFGEISIGDCFCLPFDDEQNIYLKVVQVKIVDETNESIKCEINAINIQTGKYLGLESYEQVYPIETTLMIGR